MNNDRCKCGHKKGSHNQQFGVNFFHCRFDACGKFEIKRDLKKEILELLFRHRANDRGNKDLNLFDDKAKLDEQDEYYADEILKLFHA